jgi:cell division protease FtsH
MKTVFSILLLLLPNVISFIKTSYPARHLTIMNAMRKYPISKHYHEKYIRRLNSRNQTEQDEGILGYLDDDYENSLNSLINNFNETRSPDNNRGGGIRIIINGGGAGFFNTDNPDDQYNNDYDSSRSQRTYGSRDKKSKHFEVVTKSPINFTDIGGYDNVKTELSQCVDILKNYTKYSKYNVRIPKGLIFEGPPGNGKTMLAKALAGEAHTGFISVSGSEFQEKYVGVGSARIRELFELAQKNVPCIIFIDEIDALGRKRSSEGEVSGSERDSTLNELLVAMDGFKNNTGVFVIGATNRADLLDPALVRPGRIDKRIFIGHPDRKTREAILKIHLRGKFFDDSVNVENLIEVTNGLSGAQIENLINEAMLNALRNNVDRFTSKDIDTIMNKMMVGWQPNDHQFTSDIIDNIAIHELGHAIVGMLSKHHSKMTKVIINLSAPNSPAYTMFEASTSNIYTREALFEHLMILLAGRIAEEVFFDVSVTTGAINDFEEALKLAQKMIVYYGMGKQIIYPSMSDKYKEIIDVEVANLINDAYGYSEFIIRNSKDLIKEGAEILKNDKVLSSETLLELMNTKYKNILTLKYSH